eukprot:1768145-Pyramimonas_sp.AAC.1
MPRAGGHDASSGGLPGVLRGGLRQPERLRPGVGRGGGLGQGYPRASVGRASLYTGPQTARHHRASWGAGAPWKLAVRQIAHAPPGSFLIERAIGSSGARGQIATFELAG